MEALLIDFFCLESDYTTQKNIFPQKNSSNFVFRRWRAVGSTPGRLRLV